MLARLRRTRLPELRADFRQFYGVSADEIGRGVAVSEATDLAAQLPPWSRSMTPPGDEPFWDEACWLTSRIEHALRVLAWQRTEDGQAGRNVPEMITPHARPAEPEGGVSPDELDALLARERG